MKNSTKKKLRITLALTQFGIALGKAYQTGKAQQATRELPVVRRDNSTPVPHRAHEGDAGLDLHADLGLTIQPGEWALVSTGNRVAVPAGHVGLVCPRSGLAARHGVTVMNAPGIVDHGYTGEVKVNLYNAGKEPYRVQPFERIAQLVVVPIALPTPVEVANLEESERGEGGHGSSGK